MALSTCWGHKEAAFTPTILRASQNEKITSTPKPGRSLFTAITRTQLGKRSVCREMRKNIGAATWLMLDAPYTPSFSTHWAPPPPYHCGAQLLFPLPPQLLRRYRAHHIGTTNWKASTLRTNNQHFSGGDIWRNSSLTPGPSPQLANTLVAR